MGDRVGAVERKARDCQGAQGSWADAGEVLGQLRA